MCGRFTLTVGWGEVANEFGLPGEGLDLPPRYNIAPSQFVPVVALKGDRQTRGMAMLKWGLVPFWADDPAAGPRPINLRSESVAYKFSEQFRQKRCLLPADGFYEWRTEGRRKRPHRFTLAGGGVFAFAGLWDAWTAGGGPPLLTCCSLTTTPNDLVRPIHDRMPVIVPRANYAEWLDPATPERRLRQLLVPFPAELMTVREVGPAVNKATTEGAACVEAA